MVQDSALIRRQGAHDFEAYYDAVCAKQETVPLRAVKMNLDKGMLDFNGDRLKLTDWPPILRSIAINKHLHHIAISSTYQANLTSGDAVLDRRYHKPTFRRKIPAIRSKDMTLKLCKALKDCLTVSPNLKTLHLNGLPLRERDLITLTKGLAKSSSLENLSLANCPISDDGLEVICQSIKYSTSIRTVDFTGCSLTWRGAEHVASIIKYQGIHRHGTAWAESLRYRFPQFEGMGGLRRVTLNCNTLIGDRGAAALAHELTEDLWVKAVDLQRCGLSSDGARRLLESLKTNSSLCVLDIRSNPLVDKGLIKTIIEKVLMNIDGQSPEYRWIKPCATESQRVSGPKRRALPCAVRGNATFSIASHKGTSAGGWSSAVAQTKKSYPPSRYVPWRAAARAGRQRGLPPGATVTDQSFQDAVTVKVTVESHSEGEEEEEEDDDDDGEEEVVVEVDQTPSSLHLQDMITGQRLDRVQMELKECRLRLAEERRARLKAESRLIEYELENARLRDANHSLTEALAATSSTSAPPAFSALDDDTVLESIESSFTKFHAFLDLLKDAGLGQLASMAGIEKSDFQPLGRPQLSSTIAPHVDGAASQITGGFMDVQTKTDVVSSYVIPLLSMSGVPPKCELTAISKQTVPTTVPLSHTDSCNLHDRDNVVPNLPGGAADTFTHRSPAPVSAALDRSKHVDIIFSRAPSYLANPVGSGEEEPLQYLNPDSQPDSGSEHSFRCQKSFDNVSVGKTLQTQTNHRRDDTSSHRSSYSHKYSFNNSFVSSQASHSNRSQGGLSESVSEILSDKAESVGSARSRNSGKGRLVTVGQSGSDSF